MENTPYSLSDLAAVTGNEGFGGTNGLIYILLFAMIFGGNGFGFGNRQNDATTNEILFGQQFQSLDNKIDRIGSGICDSTYALNNSINNAAYQNLAESRNLTDVIGNGFANMQKCCCDTNRNIDSVNYNGAINTASINATTTAQTQKILDAIATNRMADMQSRINALETQLATSGVVRYPSATTYTAGTSCFSSGCGCGSI